MNRPLSLHPLSLVLGLAFGALVLLSMSQVTASKDMWGPPKRDIVNVYFHTAATPISIPPGGNLIAFTVPNDRWLTITGAVGTISSGDNTFWAEALSGSVTEKGLATTAGAGVNGVWDLNFSPTSCGGAIGWTFRPGSTVVIQNDDSSATAMAFSYGLVGYLSRE